MFKDGSVSHYSLLQLVIESQFRTPAATASVVQFVNQRRTNMRKHWHTVAKNGQPDSLVRCSLRTRSGCDRSSSVHRPATICTATLASVVRSCVARSAVKTSFVHGGCDISLQELTKKGSGTIAAGERVSEKGYLSLGR